MNTHQATSSLRLQYFRLHREIYGTTPRCAPGDRWFDLSWVTERLEELLDFAADMASGVYR